MCGLHDCEKCRKKSTGATDFHGGWYLPEDSNINPLIYICVAIHLIETWINTLDKNIAWYWLAYQDKTRKRFQKP